MTMNRLPFRVFLSRLPLLLLAFAGAAAMAQADPPTRVANLSHLEGSVVLAPAGDTEWTDAVLNRPVTRGDRLWTDRGGRAEVHLGSAVLHMDGETFLDVTALDEQVMQASVNEGTVNARVRELAAGENFELDTPHLAFRASQPGDYRLDVDPARGTTRVTVRGGIALVYGASGEAQQLQAGQQVAFGGRNLERVGVQAVPTEDGFDRWALDRNRAEDQSVAARHVPREVVGYQQLDPHGSWAQDPSHGAVWFPRVTVADWAPYRYGHWQWIAPWGWTWIDDAPWGFAPFHYGRWAVIGSRWAWVPGRIGPRPIYSPALVAFAGGAGARAGWNLSIGSSPGIAWYPLAPGEAWRPAFRTTPTYVRNVNRNFAISNANDSAHVHRGRADALTAVRVEDFSRGRPVHSHWSRVNPSEITRTPAATLPALPPPRRFGDGREGRARTQPPAQVPAPVIVGRPQSQLAAPGPEHREPGDRSRGGARPFERPPQVRQDEQRRDEQRRPQAQPLPQIQQQERARRDQQWQQERLQREQQVQGQRRLNEQQAQSRREHALRQQQQAPQERQQQAIQQQQQQRAAQQQPPVAPAAAAHAAPPQRGEGGRGRGRQAQESREERRSKGEEDDRGRSRGYGRGG